MPGPALEILGCWDLSAWPRFPKRPSLCCGWNRAGSHVVTQCIQQAGSCASPLHLCLRLEGQPGGHGAWKYLCCMGCRILAASWEWGLPILPVCQVLVNRKGREPPSPRDSWDFAARVAQVNPSTMTARPALQVEAETPGRRHAIRPARCTGRPCGCLPRSSHSSHGQRQTVFWGCGARP